MPRRTDAELGLAKLTTRITQEARIRLEAESLRRYRHEASRATFGRIISEALVAHLPEGNDTSARPVKIPPQAQARGGSTRRRTA